MTGRLRRPSSHFHFPSLRLYPFVERRGRFADLRALVGAASVTWHSFGMLRYADTVQFAVMCSVSAACWQASRHARAFSHFVEKTAPQASPEASPQKL